jgi:hypothetical protein
LLSHHEKYTITSEIATIAKKQNYKKHETDLEGWKMSDSSSMGVILIAANVYVAGTEVLTNIL